MSVPVASPRAGLSGRVLLGCAAVVAVLAGAAGAALVRLSDDDRGPAVVTLNPGNRFGVSYGLYIQTIDPHGPAAATSTLIAQP
jgi:hypothetical protein